MLLPFEQISKFFSFIIFNNWFLEYPFYLSPSYTYTCFNEIRLSQVLQTPNIPDFIDFLNLLFPARIHCLLIAAGSSHC